MLLSLLIILVIILVIYGYSALLKFFFNYTKHVYEIDFVYGIIFLLFISIILNYFFPIKYFTIPIIVIGMGFFLFFYIKKIIKINLIKLILIAGFFIFISYGNELVYDSRLYHLQTIKYIVKNKIIFGLANLEPRLGMNSSWHSILSLFNLKVKDQNPIYLVNIILFTFLLNQTFKKEIGKKKLSFIFISLSLIFILAYSYFHPYKNGTILNIIGSPEVDTAAMIFFIFSIYQYLIFLENRNYENYYLVLIFCFLTITTKISYIAIFFVPLLVLFTNKKIKFEFTNRINLFLFFSLILWSLRTFILSGCFFFPIKQSCINGLWSLGKINVENYKNIISSFNRDTPDKLKWNNFNFTLESYDWFYPWLKFYFLKTELLYVSFLLLILSILYILIDKFKNFLRNKKFNINKELLLLFIINLFSIFIWLNAPEIRLGYGFIICITTFTLSIIFYNLKIEQNLINFLKPTIIIFIIAIIISNNTNINSIDRAPFSRDFIYNNFKIIYKINSYNVYKPDDGLFCNYFEDFCSYQSFKVYINKKFNYYYIENNWS